MRSLKQFFALVFLTFVIGTAIVGGCGCTSTKDVSKKTSTTSNTYEKQLEDSLRVVTRERDHLQNILNQSEYDVVRFDSTDCPTIILPDCPAMLNKDSVQRLINDLNNSINGLTNKIKINADGSREYSGRIKDLTHTLQKQQIINQTKDKEIEYWKNAKQKEKIVVQEKIVEKEVQKKTKFLNSIGFIIGIGFLLLVIGMVIGYRMRNFFKGLDNLDRNI